MNVSDWPAAVLKLGAVPVQLAAVVHLTVEAADGSAAVRVSVAEALTVSDDGRSPPPVNVTIAVPVTRVPVCPTRR